MAAILNNLGQAYRSLHNLQQAKKLYKKLWAIDKAQRGAEHIITAMSLYNLTLIYFDLGKAVKTKELLEKVLVVQQQHYGTAHVRTAIVLNSLARVYFTLGDMRQTQTYLTQAKSIFVTYFGTGHYRTACTKANLARVLFELGQTRESRKLAEKAYNASLKYYSNRCCLELVWVYRAMAPLWGQLKYYDTQNKFLRVIYNSYKHYYGETDWRTACVLHDYGCAKGMQGCWEDQKRILHEALQLKQSYYELHHLDSHLEIALTLRELGKAHMQLTEYDVSHRCLSAALNLQERDYGKSHPEVLKTKLYQAELCLAQDQQQQALQLAEQAYDEFCNLPEYVNAYHPIAKALKHFIDQHKPFPPITSSSETSMESLPMKEQSNSQTTHLQQEDGAVTDDVVNQAQLNVLQS